MEKPDNWYFLLIMRIDCVKAVSQYFLQVELSIAAVTMHYLETYVLCVFKTNQSIVINRTEQVDNASAMSRVGLASFFTL